jgi:HlyD family secretion protein
VSTWRKRVVLGVVVLAAAGGVWKWKGGKDEQPKGPAPSTLAEVTRRDLELAAEAAGLVEPIRVVEVKSRASGEVLKVPVDSGDKIDGGSLLAEIDPRDVRNALAQAVADLESAEVQRDTAEANRKRMDELRKTGTVTQSELESAVLSAAGARAGVVRAQTNLQLARERAGDVVIRAPISGTVLTRSVQPGQIIASAISNVSGGNTLFTMADLAVMQVRAKIDETDIGQVVPGQNASVSVEAYPGRVFQGTVHKIEPQAVVEQNVTLFPVLIRLENPEGLLRPGMNAEVKVMIAEKDDAIAVPNGAVVSFREARSAAQTLGLSEDALKAVMQRDGHAREQRLEAATDGGTSEVASAGGPGTGGGGGGRMGGGSRRSGGGRSFDRSGTPRPALVFVQGASGPEPRRVMVGLADWDHTEVLDGLSEGEKVVLVSVAQLQRNQKESTERFRQRAGGLMPGTGGGNRGSGGGGAGAGRGRGG